MSPTDGFDVLDVCHRQTVFALGKLAALVTELAAHGASADARQLAREVIDHFTITARHHHEDEERHLFPKLLAGGDAETAAAVRRLQQDHAWLAEDWCELEPHFDAIASGRLWAEAELLREQVEVFIALSHDHIALEEAHIYPEARARLRGRERQEMGREMAARRRELAR